MVSNKLSKRRSTAQKPSICISKPPPPVLPPPPPPTCPPLEITGTITWWAGGNQYTQDYAAPFPGGGESWVYVDGGPSYSFWLRMWQTGSYFYLTVAGNIPWRWTAVKNHTDFVWCQHQSITIVGWDFLSGATALSVSVNW